jgi:hypothetical protein
LEPDRGDALATLGLVSAGFAVASFVCPLLVSAGSGVAVFVCLLPGLLALPAGIWVWQAAGSDLAAMRAGWMDPGGYEVTQAARRRGLFGAWATALSWGLWLLVAVVLAWRAQAPGLPSAADAGTVAEMEAYLETRDLEMGPFLIDPADYANVLRLFEDGAVDPGPPAAWTGAGYVRITDRDGHKQSVVLYWTRQGAGAYTFGGRQRRGASDEEILRVLTVCHARSMSRSAP